LKGAGHLSSLDVERRHRVRIQAKGLRYAADVFHQVFEARPKRTERLLSALESLLEALGDLNDIASARALAAGLGETRDAAASERRRERDLIDAAEDAAARLKRAKPFWWEET
jgi:CHAD domain-containing protein